MRGPNDPKGTLFDASNEPILCSSLSPSGTECVIGGCDHGLRVFNVANGKQTRNLYTKKFGHSEWVSCVTYCPDGSIISGGMDKKLCLWKPNSTVCSDLLGHGHSISDVQVTANGSIIVSSSYDKTIKLWSIRGVELSTLLGHRAPVLHFAILGGYIVSGSRDGVLLAWDMSRDGGSMEFARHNGHVTAVQTGIGSSDAPLVTTGDQAGTLRLWDLRAPRAGPSQSKTLHPGGAINDIQIASNLYNSVLVTSGADKKIRISDARMNLNPIGDLGSHRDFIYTLKLLGNLILSGSGDGMLLVHDMKQDNGKLLYGLGANAAAVRCIEATENTFIAAGDDGNAIMYHFP